MTRENRRKALLSIREMVIFALLGAIMFTSKLLMEALPNIHLVGMLTMAYTIVYRGKALIPIYVFVMLTGLYTGFSPWWFPYLYAWTVLWGIAMLLPKRMPRKVACFVYPAVCSFHGLLFGVLSAPAPMISLGLTFAQAIISGLAFDITHAAGNVVAGLLVLPVSELLLRLESRLSRY